MNKNCAYTLTEAFKIHELALKNPGKAKSVTFWKEIEMKGSIIPERTSDSIRNFLRNSLKYGLLTYFKEYVTISKYSHDSTTILKAKPIT